MSCRTSHTAWLGILLAAVALCAAQERAAAQEAKIVGPQEEDAYEQAIARTRTEIEAVKSRLLARRQEISRERVELSRRVTRLTAELKEKRELSRTRLRARDDSSTGLQSARARAEWLDGQLSLARSLLLEALSQAEDRFNAVDAVLYAPECEKIKGRLEAAGEDADGAGSLASAAAGLLEFEADRSDRAGRIRRSTGQVIGPDGREIDGTYIQLGGVMALFAGQDGDAPSGIIDRPHGCGHPHVWPASTSSSQAEIRKLAGGAEATVPVDVTSGAALRVREAGLSIFEQLRAGGVVVIPILAIGVVCLLVALLKIVQLSRTPKDFDRPVARLLGLLEAGRTADARSFAESAPRPLRRVITEGVIHRQSSREDLEEILHEAILVEVPRLERHLAILAVGAVVSPLLGLLGTVTGMIHTFRLIEIFGTGDPRLLSGGISEALVTTMAGLSVAIPLVLLHALLSRRVRAVTDGLEKSAISFINALKTRNRSGIAEEPPERKETGA